MRNSGKFGYVFGEGIKGVFRNGVVNTAAIGMLIACLVITGGFASVILNINRLIADAGASNEISVFAQESMDEASVAALGERLSAEPNAAAVLFVSKAEGLESLREDFGDLLDGLEQDNPLRDKFVVTLKEQADAAKTVADIRAMDGVAKVNFNEEITAKFLRIRNSLAAAGVILMAALCTVSVFIIGSSVRISAYTRREEIGIMKTVGATDGFISGSFVAEGSAIGIAGGAAAFAVEWLLYTRLFAPRLSELSLFSVVPFSDFSLYMLAAFLSAGLLMGILGSSLSIRRYLKV